MAQKSIVMGAEAKPGENPVRENLVALFLVLSYLAVSIAFFYNVEDWSAIDCVYYAMVIVTTVGYGDVVPVSKGGKVFTIFFAFYGICTIGIALGRLARLFLNRQKSIAKEATQKLLTHVDHAHSVANTLSPGLPTHNPAVDKEQSVSIPVAPPNGQRPKKAKWRRVLFSRSNLAILSALMPIAVSIGGGLIVGAIEGWPILDCFYYSIVTITTIGFGDLSPKSRDGRLFAIFYLPLAVVSVAHGIGSVIEEISKRSVMKTKISMKELLAMDSDGDGKVSQLEYLSYMLVKLNKADQDDIDGILTQFKKLDKDGSGELDKADLERIDRELQRAQQEHDELYHA
uniref:EF-hand domain-containing protein n=1 Tax=Globisporangium ultimum (strain ATCC 200006 / CBS 805.95 / DAOM BR144) TaxID=431595 RepID=K3X659_GLOUD